MLAWLHRVAGRFQPFLQALRRCTPSGAQPPHNFKQACQVHGTHATGATTPTTDSQKQFNVERVLPVKCHSLFIQFYHLPSAPEHGPREHCPGARERAFEPAWSCVARPPGRGTPWGSMGTLLQVHCCCRPPLRESSLTWPRRL